MFHYPGSEGLGWEGQKEKLSQSSPGFAICLVKLVRDLYSDLYGPQKVADEGNSPAISVKSRLVKYYSIWPDTWKTI